MSVFPRERFVPGFIIGPTERPPLDTPEVLDLIHQMRGTLDQGAIDKAFARALHNGTGATMTTMSSSDTITVEAVDLVEVDGVWMTPADARHARPRLKGPK